MFDSHLRAVDDFSALSLDGTSSSLDGDAQFAVAAVSRPAAGRRAAAHRRQCDRRGRRRWAKLPPIYPVVVGDDDAPPDVSVAGVSVSQTNFESAPVTVRADIASSGFAGQSSSPS